MRSGGRGEAEVARELAVPCSVRHGVRRARARALEVVGCGRVHRRGGCGARGVAVKQVEHEG